MRWAVRERNRRRTRPLLSEVGIQVLLTDYLTPKDAAQARQVEDAMFAMYEYMKRRD